jgi:glycosyltransferase involved in cell wall biosynthesis
LNKRSISNILCTYHHGRDIEDIDTIRIARIPGYTKRESGPSGFKYLADILLFFKTCSVIMRRRPDIIHGHLHEGALIGWAARLFFFWRRIPLVFDVQGSLTGELDAHGHFRKLRFLKGVFERIEYVINRMPDRFICSSQNSIDILNYQFDVREDVISLVNDGAEILPEDSTNMTNPGLDLPPDKAIVIYTGALLESKGLTHLRDVILEAKGRNINCHFLVVGYPEQVMHDFCRQHNLQGLCTVVGQVPFEILGNYLLLADMALEPKFSESGEASGKLLNYMGAGLPVICFDTVSNRQMLGEAGYYAQPGSGSDLVEQINGIINRPDDGRRRGLAGKRRAMERYSWDASVDKVIAAYESCLKELPRQ